MPEGQTKVRDIAYNALVEKIYKGDKTAADSEIKRLVDDRTAQNDLSAIRKLTREKGIVDVQGEQNVAGNFVQLYKRRDDKAGEERGYSAYIINNAGVQTIHIEDEKLIPDPRKGDL